MRSLRPEQIQIRPLDGRAEYVRAVELQRLTWGAGFDEVVPPAILYVAQHTGGIASGAFAPDGSLVGFVFGISGIEDGRPIHWSDMLAVHPEARGLGLGVALKLHQRELLLERGIDTVYWTFDPLEARNAHINFRRLGVVARRYLRDLYGETGSDLHAGIGTDRLVAEWRLRSPRVIARLSVPAADAEAGHPATESAGGEDGASARIPVPLDIQAVKRSSLQQAMEWRRVTRAAFEDYLGRGWIVADTEQDDVELRYLLRPPGH